jgi:hypothetical protein
MGTLLGLVGQPLDEEDDGQDNDGEEEFRISFRKNRHDGHRFHLVWFRGRL